MHLKPTKTDREAAEADPLVAIAGGGGVNLYNSAGSAWTADYLKITGEMDVDLRSNIAAEARAKIVYERLIDFCDDSGSKDALQFLMTREITHMKAFMLALDSMGKPPLQIGKIPPTPGLVDQFFNDSTGEGENGAVDTKGPWKDKGAFKMVDNPAFHPEKMEVDGGGAASPRAEPRCLGPGVATAHRAQSGHREGGAERGNCGGEEDHAPRYPKAQQHAPQAARRSCRCDLRQAPTRRRSRGSAEGKAARTAS